MIIALLAALVASIAVFAVILDRALERGKRERDADREERQVLLQRIQAPEAAVYEHATLPAQPDPDGSPMTDEQMAEREERTRVLAFIERHENGGPG